MEMTWGWDRGGQGTGGWGLGPRTVEEEEGESEGGTRCVAWCLGARTEVQLQGQVED